LGFICCPADVIWPSDTATAGLVLAQVVDPGTAQAILAELTGI
jgi:hypothetical protein